MIIFGSGPGMPRSTKYSKRFFLDLKNIVSIFHHRHTPDVTEKLFFMQILAQRW
jgi:hypothetical protein